MKKLILLSLVTIGISAAASSTARAGGISVGFVAPLPFLPPVPVPVVQACPAPVVVSPAVVVGGYGPVVYQRPVVVARGYDRDFGHDRFDHRRWDDRWHR